MKTTLILLNLIFATAAHAQETFTWKMAVVETWNNNPELKAAKEKLQSQDAQIGVAKSGYFPQLSGTLSYQKNSTQSLTASPTGVTTTQSGETYGATLSVSQNVFNGLQDKAKVDQAKAEFHKLEATQQSTVAKIGADLKNAYSSLLFAQNLVRLQGTIIKRREENLKLVELRFKSGRENRGSFLLAQAYAKQAGFDLLSAKNSTSAAITDLERVVGHELSEPKLAAEIPLMPIPTKSPNFRELAGQAPETLENQASVKSAEASVTVAQGGFYPTLALNASTGKQGREFFPDRDKWSVGASLTLPFFNGGKDYYSVQSAASSLHAARATLDNVTRRKTTEVEQAFNAYVEATEKLKVDTAFREAGILRAEIARAKYNNGLMSFEDWDLVESDLIAREKAVVQSERERVKTEAQWAQIQGLGVLP